MSLPNPLIPQQTAEQAFEAYQTFQQQCLSKPWLRSDPCWCAECDRLFSHFYALRLFEDGATNVIPFPGRRR